ncbi:hypothetical protein SVIO_103830 [Streptomyces violaceusniger]|uniref:Uncharacterized protein n=1 Tax=Streptomyces violaceusniger TaxID=68280 RepID=A0A4D4LKL4_STRVO|nr:hypothetical protein SVIO_103830 [Streptomyces violaceusniger]
MFAAAGPLLAGIGGAYLEDNDISPLDEDPAPIAFGTDQDPPADVVPHAIDPRSARRLWEMSEELITAMSPGGQPRGASGHQTLAVGVDDRLHPVPESEFGEDA